jgi:hypothetical protein
MKITLFAASFAALSLSLGSVESRSQDVAPPPPSEVSSSSTAEHGESLKAVKLDE